MLGISRVYVATLECDAGYSGIEVFIFEFAYFTAVHRIGPVGVEPFYIEFVGALTYFFVGSEGNAYFPVFYFGVGDEVFHSRNDFGNTSFVVCP